ncbi:MAG: hypothetical protein WBI71_07920 [Methanothermobacter tenebrarum]
MKGETLIYVVEENNIKYKTQQRSKGDMLSYKFRIYPSKTTQIKLLEHLQMLSYKAERAVWEASKSKPKRNITKHTRRIRQGLLRVPADPKSRAGTAPNFNACGDETSTQHPGFGRDRWASFVREAGSSLRELGVVHIA